LIIEAEAHAVSLTPDGVHDSTPDLIKYMDKYNIDASVILPGAGESNVSGKVLEKVAKKNAKRLIPFCRFVYGGRSPKNSPGKAGNDLELEELDQMLRSGIFRGVGELSVKEMGLEDPLKSVRAFYPFMDIIAKFKVPVQFHTGTGVGKQILASPGSRSVPIRFLDPSSIDDLASRYTEIPFIINHCGGMLPPYSDASLYVGAKNFNVSFILSNLNLVHDPVGQKIYAKFVAGALNFYGVGASRLIFASDWYPEFDRRGFSSATLKVLNKIKMSESERDQIMGENMKRLLRI
jgi:predicted TIM-barrel fold metal-dependent hydrolase